MSQVPILAGNFQLIQGGVSAENVDRFVKCFTEAWNCLADDQKTLQTHYRSRAVVVL
jgi:hypothetical protein